MLILLIEIHPHGVAKSPVFSSIVIHDMVYNIYNSVLRIMLAYDLL